VDIAKVDPGVRELVSEQGAAADKRPLTISDPRTLPVVPALSRNGMCARSDRQQIKNGSFAIAFPPVRDETAPGPIAVTEQRRRSVEHPFEIDTIVEPLRHDCDFRILAPEIAARGESTSQQKSGMDRRKFGVQTRLAGAWIHEMQKESADLGREPAEEPERGDDAVGSLGGIDPAALHPNAQGG